MLDVKNYGVCAGFTQAKFSFTTGVYPDSTKTNPQKCIKAQVAAIEGGLNWIIKNIKF